MVRLCILFLILLPLQAWSASFDATIDKTTVTWGYPLTLTLTLTDAQAISKPDLSEVYQGFEMLGETKSTSISIVNGARSKQTIWRYKLKPKKQGDVVIQPLTVESDQGNLTSESITINVSGTAVLPTHDIQKKVQIDAVMDNNTTYVKENSILTIIPNCSSFL